jgi:Peptide-N-glycosidase F, C terminal/Concanavalin A-like lectin/glucanases superfamily/Secretion system C-terminal sorting domain
MYKTSTLLTFIAAVSIALFSSLNLPTQASDAFSGDTTVVRTFRYDTTMRAGMFDFPDDTTKTYEKIIMLYSMRCKNGLISNSSAPNQGCGEWDYNCYTYLIDSTQTDSLKQTSNDYYISNFSGTSFPYTTTPLYNYVQYTQQNVTYLSTISETTSQSGTGSTGLSHPFSSSNIARTQYLWTAAELASAGLTAGNITGLGLDLSSLGSNVNNLRIKIKATNQTVLNANSPELNGFTEVYFLNSTFSTTGAHRFNFYNNFNWNGTSNLIVEFSYSNVVTGTSNVVNGNSTGFASAMTSGGADNYLEIDGGAAGVNLPNSVGANISNQITLAFWCYGNPARLPANTSVFEALDANNVRQLNVHLPWSDGSIYWDCGNDGTGYDRINKAAATSETEGQWNFWAFTKNATTGVMNIYLNGALWHTGTAKTKPINIDRMNFARSVVNNYAYYGYMDEFSMWNTDLNLAAVQGLMYNSITPSHPNYSNLQAYYKFDEGTGNVISDASSNGNHANMFSMTWRNRGGKDLFRNFTVSNDRPNTTFVKGVYNTSIQTINVLDSTSIPANTVIQYTVINNSIAPVDTNYYWAASGYTYLFDEMGAKLDSFLVSPTSTISINQIAYYDKRPMTVELINFITPYGLGLNLNGLIGKTWEFDVTDYAPILKGRKFMAMDAGKYQEDNDITFVYYEGTPTRKVRSLQQIWPCAVWKDAGSAAILNNTMFEPRNIELNPDAYMYKIRSSVSGHGQEGEFIPRNHTITINGSTNLARSVWTECAANPIYPQGGTWVYDRAGWCPGAAVDTKEFEITAQVSPGQMITVDYSIPQATNYGTSNYRINNQLITYDTMSFSVDAGIAYIKNPTNRVEYERFNPVCNQPVVAIKNNGSNMLNSATITYGRMGGLMSTYNWTGTLAPLTSLEVTLPQPNWLSSNTNQFIAIVSNPNGGTDQYGLNDTLINNFNYPVVYPDKLIFELRTNNNGSHTTYTLKDGNGTNVLNKLGLLGNTTYLDTVNLPMDCYTFKLNDAGDDGLSWWANTAQGTGYMRIRNGYTGAIIRTFNPDFGDNIFQQFTINYTLPVPELESGVGSLKVYPNPANSLITAEFSIPVYGQARLQMLNMLGQVLISQDIVASQMVETSVMDVSTLAPGVYYVTLQSGDEKRVQRVVITR